MAKTNRARRATALTATALAVVSSVATSVAQPTVALAAVGSRVAAAAVPVVTVASPATGDAAGGTAVSIAGAGFKSINPANLNSVLFGTTPADRIVILSDTRLVAVSPPGTGNVVIKVVNPDGPSTGTSAKFGYRMRLVADFADTPAKASGGTEITAEVSGGSMGASASAFAALKVTAKVGGVAASRVTWVDASHIKITTPATTKALPATVQLFQDGYAGPESTGTVAYYPTVASVSAGSLAAEGGASIEIKGTGFLAVDPDDPAAVTIGGVPVTSFDVDSATLIYAEAPAGEVGTVSKVQVTTPGGTTPEAEAPAVAYRGPMAVDTSGDQFVRASGGIHVFAVTGGTLGDTARDFAAAKIAVRLGATKLTPTYVDATHLKVTLPAMTTETADLVVLQDTLVGPKVTLPVAPVVLSLSAVTSPLAGGGTVQIKVAGAGSGAATDFTFGDNPADCRTTGSGTGLTYVCTVPEAAQAGPTWVRFTSGTGTASRFTGTAAFSYTDLD
ncbi:IPT/TIG domain-containing protein [Actinoplanes ianthinogenes]|nr:IPT/TIG domain-containing protein [Actinoplanes ianthinogenes]